MQKQQLLQLQNDLTRKKILTDFLIQTVKNSTMTMNEKTALKKAIDVFNLSISGLERTISIELKKEGE